MPICNFVDSLKDGESDVLSCFQMCNVDKSFDLLILYFTNKDNFYFFLSNSGIIMEMS